MIQSAKDIVSNNSNCIGIRIPNVGHGISFVNPDFFNQMIEKWLLKGVLPQEAITIT
jgi:pimeloyl-ACP methyl ester carboxylesterase